MGLVFYSGTTNYERDVRQNTLNLASNLHPVMLLLQIAWVGKAAVHSEHTQQDHLALTQPPLCNSIHLSW
jgi:hypothetical protein